MYATEGGICCKYGILGAQHQFDDSRWRGSYDKQTIAGGSLHGVGGWEFFEFGNEIKTVEKN